MKTTGRHDYPTKRIGRGNPYMCCAFCGISEPGINGRLNGHHSSCQWRRAQAEIYLTERRLRLGRDIDVLEKAFKAAGVMHRRFKPHDTDGGDTAEVIEIMGLGTLRFTVRGEFFAARRVDDLWGLPFTSRAGPVSRS